MRQYLFLMCDLSIAYIDTVHESAGHAFVELFSDVHGNIPRLIGIYYDKNEVIELPNTMNNVELGMKMSKRIVNLAEDLHKMQHVPMMRFMLICINRPAAYHKSEEMLNMGAYMVLGKDDEAEAVLAGKIMLEELAGKEISYGQARSFFSKVHESIFTFTLLLDEGVVKYTSAIDMGNEPDPIQAYISLGLTQDDLGLVIDTEAFEGEYEALKELGVPDMQLHLIRATRIEALKKGVELHYISKVQAVNKSDVVQRDLSEFIKQQNNLLN